MNARTQAIRAENDAIDASQSRAMVARSAESKPRNALEKMAARLDLSPDVLKGTLMKTAFSACRSNEEFVALVAVANEYNLNPMLKEIYAFPAKGGGIVPMVGYDGWVKLMNSHPQFDGIEYDDHLDSKGSLYAIEVVIYRKDRSRPIKLMEVLDECRRPTEPWKMMPSRMLRNRVTCQGARLAFGFTGITPEGEEDFIDGGTITAVSLPTQQTLAEQLGDEIPKFDKQTGEIVDDQPRNSSGMTEVDEETSRSLDVGETNDGTLSEENPTAAEGPADEQRGEPEDLSDNVDQIKVDLAAAKSRDALKDVEQAYLRLCGAWPKDVCDQIEALISAKRKAL